MVLKQSLCFTLVHWNLNTNGAFVLAAFGLVLAVRASLQRDRVIFVFFFFASLETIIQIAREVARR